MNIQMKKILIVSAAFFVITAVGVLAYNSGQGLPKNTEGIVEITGTKEDQIKRGAYLESILGGNDLRSNVQNISSWTEQQFFNAARTGKASDNTGKLVPPASWQMYSKLNDEDLGAIFAYLNFKASIGNAISCHALSIKQK